MERDWNQIRAILEAIVDDKFEEYVNKYGYHYDDSCMTEQEKQEARSKVEYKIRYKVLYHVELLCDSDLIRGVELVKFDTDETIESMEITRPRLTMQGHDFLENLRNPKIWRKVKDIAAKAGVEITFELIKQAIPKILGSIIE